MGVAEPGSTAISGTLRWTCCRIWDCPCSRPTSRPPGFFRVRPPGNASFPWGLRCTTWPVRALSRPGDCGVERGFLEASCGEAGPGATICGAVPAKELEWVPDSRDLTGTAPVNLHHSRQHPRHRCQHAHVGHACAFPLLLAAPTPQTPACSRGPHLRHSRQYPCQTPARSRGPRLCTSATTGSTHTTESSVHTWTTPLHLRQSQQHPRHRVLSSFSQLQAS